MVATDGSGSTDASTSGMPATQNPIFRPVRRPAAAVPRRGPTDGTWGIYLMDRDGTNLQPPGPGPGFAGRRPTTSTGRLLRRHLVVADGTSPRVPLAGSRSPTSTAGPGFRIHVADDRPGRHGNRRADAADFDPAADDEFDATLAADGDAVVYERRGDGHRSSDRRSRRQPGRARDLARSSAWSPTRIGDLAIAPDGRRSTCSSVDRPARSGRRLGRRPGDVDAATPFDRRTTT